MRTIWQLSRKWPGMHTIRFSEWRQILASLNKEIQCQQQRKPFIAKHSKEKPWRRSLNCRMKNSHLLRTNETLIELKCEQTSRRWRRKTWSLSQASRLWSRHRGRESAVKKLQPIKLRNKRKLLGCRRLKTKSGELRILVSKLILLSQSSRARKARAKPRTITTTMMMMIGMILLTQM
mgnify:CR=1 FL=1